MKWLLSLLLVASPPLAFLQGPPSTVQARLTGVDRVERELRLTGQRRPFVGVFSTRLTLDGQSVRPAQFWRTVRPGMVAIIKSRNYGPFRVVDVVNVRTGEK